MAKIIRTKTMARGGITDHEKKLMEEHTKLWISRAMRTDPIEPDKIIPAIKGLYAAAKLKEPRIVIVPSPLVMAFAYGASAAIWYARKHPNTDATTRAATDAATYGATRKATRAATDEATRAATDAATRAATSGATSATSGATSATSGATHEATNEVTDAATRAATLAATYAATRAATYAATPAATYDSTYDATLAATYAATHDATRAATDAATYAATHDATRAATRDATDDATRVATRDVEIQAAHACKVLAGDFGIQCAARWANVYQGGNFWAGYDSYLTACRDILGLELPSHAAYAHWEQAAIHSGFRVMHEEFCMVCDFPEIILKDDQNRPHCETGPSHRWRDGWSLYHWHGVRVPSHWIEDRETLDPAEVLRETNVERRAAGAAIIGWPRMVSKLKRKIIDGDPETDIGALIELTLPGLKEPGRFLQAICPRNGTIVEGVPRVSDIDGLPIETAIAAQAWRDGLPANEYQHPMFRT